MNDPIIASRDLERHRCALIAEGLATRWEASAAKLRERKARFLWIGPAYTLPEAERDARSIDAAAHGLRTVAKLIRDGLQPPRTQERSP